MRCYVRLNFILNTLGGKGLVVYAVILFIAAVTLLVIGALVYRGKTSLIHAYHQTHVQDKLAYGKAMGKALMGMSIPLLLAGITALFTTSVWPIFILLVGLAVALVPMFLVQKKYNGGVF